MSGDAAQDAGGDAAAPEVEGDSDTYKLVLGYVRLYVQWVTLLVCGLGTLLVFWVHWGNSAGDYSEASSGDDFTTKDTSSGIKWRRLFTLTPEKFLDQYTTLVFGGIETLQHLGYQYQTESISGTWIKRAIWLFIMSLFGQFGYAGNLGCYVGYITCFGVALPCLLLSVLDHEFQERDSGAKCNDTVAKAMPLLADALAMCGADKFCPALSSVQRQHSTKAPVEPVGGTA